MRGKSKIEENLIKYNLKYVNKGNQIIIYLDFSHQILINIEDDNKIIIKDRLVHWNFLTGGISMSLKNAMIYNFIGINLFIIVFLFYEFKENTKSDFIPFFLGYIAWILLFTLYYSIKFESLKNNIISWTKD